VQIHNYTHKARAAAAADAIDLADADGAYLSSFHLASVDSNTLTFCSLVVYRSVSP